MTLSHERVAQQHQPNMPRIGREALSHARQPLRRDQVNPSRPQTVRRPLPPENMSLHPADFPTDRIDTDRLRQIVEAEPRTQTLKKERRLTPKKGVAIGAISLAAIFGVGAAVASHLDEQKPIETSQGLNPDTKPTLPPETLSLIESFDAKRADVLAKIMQKFFDQGFKMEDHHMYEGRQIELASPNMTTQAVLDRHSAKEAFITKYAGSKQEALSQVQLVARPGTDAFKDVSTAVEVAMKDHNPILDEDILISSKRFENGKITDPRTGEVIAEAHGVPTMVVSSMSQNTRTVAVRTFQYETAPDGKTGDWQQVYGSSANHFPFDFNTLDQLPGVDK